LIIHRPPSSVLATHDAADTGSAFHSGDGLSLQWAPGAWDRVKLDDPALEKVLYFAMSNLTAGGLTYLKPSIVKAHVQVVGGLKYKINVRTVRSETPREVEEHEFIIWHKPNAHMMVIEHNDVTAAANAQAHALSQEHSMRHLVPGRRHAVGGYSGIAVDDPGLIAAAAFGLRELNRAEQTRYRPVEVVRAAVQVVAGLQYRIVLKITASGQPPHLHFLTVWDRFGELKLVNHRICVTDEDCQLRRGR